jgi:metallo-beta-lactamase class B
MPLRSLLVLVAGCCVVLPCASGAGSSSTPLFARARIEWNATQNPFRIYGNTWYVGPHGLSAILVDTGKGLALFDGDLPESAPQIEAHLRNSDSACVTAA